MDVNKTHDTTTNNNKEANSGSEIRKLYQEYEAAIKKQDLDKIMSFYSPDIVAFDIVPPLQFNGIKSYRKSWEEAFASCVSDSEMKSEVKDLNITANDTIAYAHGLVHNIMTPKNGEKVDMWMRCTRCFEKQGGKWLITHEQYSVPVDFKSGKALMDLKPETKLH